MANRLGITGVLAASLVACTAGPGSPRSTADGSPIAAAAASAAPAASPDVVPAALPPVDDGSPAQPVDLECVVARSEPDFAEPITIDLAAKYATGVVIGTVEEVGPTEWRNGEPPESQPSALDVFRLVRFRVDGQQGADVNGSAVVIAIPGGEIGCSRYVIAGFPDDVEVGDQYALFLNEASHPTSKLDAVPVVYHVWKVDDGRVETPADGAVALDEFLAAVEKATR